MPDQTRPNDSALITIHDAARELNCSPITIRRMIRRGRLKALRFSATMVRLRRDDVLKLITEAGA